MTAIYRWNGEYFGFLADDRLYAADGTYLGWSEDGQVWLNSGRFLGEIVEDHYLLKRIVDCPHAPKPPRVAVAGASRAGTPRAPKNPLEGWVDALDDV